MNSSDFEVLILALHNISCSELGKLQLHNKKTNSTLQTIDIYSKFIVVYLRQISVSRNSWKKRSSPKSFFFQSTHYNTFFASLSSLISPELPSHIPTPSTQTTDGSDAVPPIFLWNFTSLLTAFLVKLSVSVYQPPPFPLAGCLLTFKLSQRKVTALIFQTTNPKLWLRAFLKLLTLSSIGIFSRTYQFTIFNLIDSMDSAKCDPPAIRLAF